MLGAFVYPMIVELALLDCRIGAAHPLVRHKEHDERTYAENGFDDTLYRLVMSFDEDRKKALECGMNGFLSKPIVIEELISTLQNNLTD